MKSLLLGCVFGLSLSFGVCNLAVAQSSYTEVYRYDSAGRLVGTILPDPDGAGPNRYSANRITYNALGLVSLMEFGELSSFPSSTTPPSQWSGFTVHRSEARTYDAKSRLHSVLTRSNGQAIGLVQYSYDQFSRLTCTAQRMNPAAFTTLIASSANACVQGVEGVYGKDRISRMSYDGRSRVTKAEIGIGTTLRQDQVRYTYNGANQVRYLTDANGNRTEYVYDGLGRLKQLKFPSKTQAGEVSTTDYEEYGYDANGNRTSVRRRNGRTIGYVYDALNQVVLKDLPNTTSGDVYYGYDLRGGLVYARFGSAVGSGVVNSYTGFGEVSAQTSTVTGVSRTVTHQYDSGGNRVQVVHPDGAVFEYAYDGYGRLQRVSDGAGAPLASYRYDGAGYRNRVDWGTAGSTYYVFDGASRLLSLSHDVGGDESDVTYGFTYSPSGQMISQGINNATFRMPVTATERSVAGQYVSNGLNQYTSAGGGVYSYDANGNFVSDGASTLTYDDENRLISVRGVVDVDLKYDPLGRLYEVAGVTLTRFQYDGDALIGEYDASQNLAQRYVHGDGIDDPIVWFEGNASGASAARYFLADRQKSVVLAVDAQGNTLYRNVYHPYGTVEGGGNGRFRYTGQAYLPEVGLHYYKARMYGALFGRFLQADPVGYQDQFNLYAYVNNDPMNNIDPTGQKGININLQFRESGQSYYYDKDDGTFKYNTLYVRYDTETKNLFINYDKGNVREYYLEEGGSIYIDDDVKGNSTLPSYTKSSKSVLVFMGAKKGEAKTLAPYVMQQPKVVVSEKTSINPDAYMNSESDYVTLMRGDFKEVNEFKLYESETFNYNLNDFNLVDLFKSVIGGGGTPMGVIDEDDMMGGGNANCPASAADMC